MTQFSAIKYFFIFVQFVLQIENKTCFKTCKVYDTVFSAIKNLARLEQHPEPSQLKYNCGALGNLLARSSGSKTDFIFFCLPLKLVKLTIRCSRRKKTNLGRKKLALQELLSNFSTEVFKVKLKEFLKQWNYKVQGKTMKTSF